MTATTLYSFTGTSSDGANPFGGVTIDAAGDLFGTTYNGGANSDGTVWEIVHGTTTVTTLYSFTGTGTGGADPQAGVTLDANGNLYGTTPDGGASGGGTVWEIKAGTTTATTLYSFTGAGTDGVDPVGGVTIDAHGNLFGTTFNGGSNSSGTVWEIRAGTTAAFTFYSFIGSDANGINPPAGVTFDVAGDMFGTTENGGTSGDGTVWEIKAGTTTATTLYSFTGMGTDGANPTAGVTIDAAGDLFGTTQRGGSSFIYGTVWEIKAGTTAATTLVSFASTDGAYPTGVTLDAAGDLFGTTTNGGTSDGGTVWEIVHGTTALITLYNFTGSGTDGGYPDSGVTFDSSGDLIGDTANGGTSNDGTVYEIANAVCYYPGTLILTATGPRTVESLAIGDSVMTAGGRAMPIRWIGRNTVSTRFADPLRVLPIRIRAGALGGGLPQRDLLVSPEHALLVDDILIQAGALVNGLSIIRETHVPETFTYYHVECAEHALLLAEGTAAESFVDNVHRMAFDNWAEHAALYNDAAITELPHPRGQSQRQVPRETKMRLMAQAEALFGPVSIAA